MQGVGASTRQLIHHWRTGHSCISHSLRSAIILRRHTTMATLRGDDVITCKGDECMSRTKVTEYPAGVSNVLGMEGKMMEIRIGNPRWAERELTKLVDLIDLGNLFRLVIGAAWWL